MKTIILDTNFLLIPHQFKINIMAKLEQLLEQAHELVVSTAIVNELKKIAKTKGKQGTAAKVALTAIEKNKIRLIQSQEKDADAWIINYCLTNPQTIVCTNDINLRNILKKNKIRAITMRTKTQLFWA